MEDHSADFLMKSEYSEQIDPEFSKLLRKALSLESRARGIKESRDVLEVIGFTSLSSTMDAARALDEMHGSEAGLLLASRRQTRGRGRFERPWYSENEGGAYLTFVFRPEILPERLLGYSLVLGLAVSKTLEEYGVESRLKWPNDVLSADCSKKLAGILVETGVLGNTVTCIRAGIGLNINQESFPDGVPGSSMRKLSGREYDYEGVIAKLALYVQTFHRRCISEGFSPFQEQWWRKSCMPETRISFESARGGGEAVLSRGVVKGIGEDGGLVVSLGESGCKSQEIVYSGEVKI